MKITFWNLFNFTFCLVLVTGGRTFGWFHNGMEKEFRCYNDTEIIGSEIPFAPHPKIWGHSLALTNDYRVLFCGGINTSPFKTPYEIFTTPRPENWHIVQSRGLASIFLTLMIILN